MTDLRERVEEDRGILKKIQIFLPGYSGISAAVRILEDELNKLYEYDLALFEAVNALALKAKEARGLADAGRFAEGKPVLSSLKGEIMEFSATFDRRMETVAGIEVA